MKKNIIQKFLDGPLDREEARVLRRWLKKPENKKTLKEEVQMNHLINTCLHEFDAQKAFDLNKQKRSTVHNIRKEVPKVKRFPAYEFIKYAAIFVGLLGIGYFFFNQLNINNNKLIIPEESIVLELEDGTQKTISNSGNQQIMNQSGQIVGLQMGDTLLYQNIYSSKSGVYNTLKVPYGKTCKLVLADGSFVQLNAGSQLRYPTRFSEDRRTVFLTGEAYFEIAHDAEHPFIVNTQEIMVEVLGTKFNISAYPEDPNVETVLIEGSVSLSSEKPGKQVLVPGQLGDWDIGSEELKISEVDVSDYTAWTRGILLFHQKTFKEIIPILERKYNISIINNYPELNEGRYRGTFTKESIEDVMKTFTDSRLFEYHINNNTLIIEKPEGP